MLALEDVVDLEAGPVPIEPLVVAVREADVDAGVLSDEEIVLMSSDPDREPEPQFDAPRLARLSAEERDVAVASAVWVLRAHDLIRPREDGEMVSVGLAAIVGDIRWGSEATVRVRTDVRGQGIARAAVYRAPPELS